jgi:hypothetical protein
LEAELNLEELITDPDPNLQIISDPDAQHWLLVINTITFEYRRALILDITSAISDIEILN